MHLTHEEAEAKPGADSSRDVRGPAVGDNDARCR